VQLHPQKTRVVHVQRGFEFLGYLVRRGKQLKLPPGRIVTGAKSGGLYAYPREKSIQRFKGSGTSAYQAWGTAQDQGSDRATKPSLAGVGSLLQACPRPNALQQTRQLDRAAYLVASVQVLAQQRLETASEAQDVRRVWVGTTGETDSFHCSAEASAFVKAWRGKTAHHV
jgi:hypothetical protein